MHEYSYVMDGIKHEIKSSNPFPPSVKLINKSEIYISPKQQQVCRNLKRILLEWVRIADELNIQWFFNGGSLLGVLRDKGLIFYDNDIDLVVQMKDHSKLLNYNCNDNFLLRESEVGFNLSLRNKKFPFMDIWIIGNDKTDATKMTVCSPVLDGEPLYYLNKVWPNEWYFKKDLKELETATFEGIEVFVPRNAEQIVKRMYGPNCLEEYRIESHTEDHEALSTGIMTVENRVKLGKALAKLNRTLRLDSTKNVDGHLSCLIGKTIAELTAVSASDKHKRIHKHFMDFLRAQID
jgi:hypothetical protein